MRSMIPGADLDLSNEQHLSAADRGWLAASIIAHSRWPDEDERRKAFLTGVGARQLDAMHRKYAAIVAECGRRLAGKLPNAADMFAEASEEKQFLLSREWFHRHGGYGATNTPDVTGLFGREVKTAVQKALYAGLTLILTKRMDLHHAKDLKGEASLTKVRALIEKFYPPARGIIGDTSLKNAWAAKKDGAHLSAAVLCISAATDVRTGQRSRFTFAGSVDFPVRTACLAAEFLEFGCNFKPQAQNSPIMNRDTVWSLKTPNQFTGVVDNLSPLPAEQLEYLYGARD